MPERATTSFRPGRLQTFVYASGDGNDMISESVEFLRADSIDKLKLTDLSSADIELSRSGNDLLVKILGHRRDHHGVVAVRRAHHRAGCRTGGDQFANGVGRATDPAERMVPRDGRPRLHRTRCPDERYVEAGQGDDLILSGTGSDTFLYSRGDGNDLISRSLEFYGPTDIDILKFTDIDGSDVQLSRSGDKLIVKIISTNETISVMDQFSDPPI